MRVLVVTRIFPSAAAPRSSPFNRQQFAALGRRVPVEVLATIPWFPGARWWRRWSAAGRDAAAPARELIDGIPVEHPRFLYLPRTRALGGGPLYATSLLAPVLARRDRCDVVLGSWAYPDGWAAVALARLLGVPSVIKVHGSDLERPPRAGGTRWALAHADRVVAVSRALAELAVAHGAPEARVTVVPNGVDAALFHPGDRASARHELGLDGRRVIAFVGRLERDKGVRELLAAFVRLAHDRRDVTLALIGDGPERALCDEVARTAPVRVVGARPLEEVPRWLHAADLVALPSWHEGSPNALVEALACGRPVVASTVGGIPELVDAPSLGELVPPREIEPLAAALARVLDGVAAGDYGADAIAGRGARGGWDESAARLEAVLADAVVDHARRAWDARRELAP